MIQFGFLLCMHYYYLTAENIFLPFSRIRFEIISTTKVVCHCSVKPYALVLIFMDGNRVQKSRHRVGVRV